MFKTTLALSLVLLAGSVLGAAAQSPEEGLLFIPQGRAQSVPFKSLGGASVGNVVVAYIQRKGLDEVSIYGAVPGETWLDLVGRDGRRKRFSVRVAPAAQAETSAPADAIAPKASANTPAAEVAAHTQSPAAVPVVEPAAAKPS